MKTRNKIEKFVLDLSECTFDSDNDNKTILHLHMTAKSKKKIEKFKFELMANV